MADLKLEGVPLKRLLDRDDTSNFRFLELVGMPGVIDGGTKGRSAIVLVSRVLLNIGANFLGAMFLGREEDSP